MPTTKNKTVSRTQIPSKYRAFRPRIVQLSARYLLKIFGWKVEGSVPPTDGNKNLILIAGPHTSNWDGIFGFAAILGLDAKISFFGKYSLFTKPLLGRFLKYMGGIPVDKSKALEMNLVSEEQYSWLEKTSIDIYNQMSVVAENAGFILADLKLEFGLLDGKITLGDSIGPDEYRLWPKDTFEIGKIQESYDKQILRDWLTANGYQKQFENDRNNGREPVAPEIPSEIIQTITQRYIIAYEKLTGLSI